jgi:hypothetical protein
MTEHTAAELNAAANLVTQVHGGYVAHSKRYALAARLLDIVKAHFADEAVPYPNVTRVEVVADGREYVGYFEPGVRVDFQDDGKTMKVFAGAHNDEAVKAKMIEGLTDDYMRARGVINTGEPAEDIIRRLRDGRKRPSEFAQGGIINPRRLR